MIQRLYPYKHLLMSLMFVIVALCATSCDEDDDNYYDSYSSPLRGEWYSPETDTYFDFDGDGDGVYEDAYGEYDFTWSAGSGWLNVY